MNKRYGIRMTLPTDDPMRAAHLLGADWEGFRWYATTADRNEALSKLSREDVYYRRGDRQSLVLEAIDR